MHKLAKHDLILKCDSFPRTHFVDHVLIIFGICVWRSCLKKIGLSNMVIFLLHQVLSIFDVNEKLEDLVVLFLYSKPIDDNFYWPVAIITNFKTLQIFFWRLLNDSRLGWVIKLNIHVAHNRVFVQILQRSIKKLTKTILKVAINQIKLILERWNRLLLVDFVKEA